ncbi:GAF domain-containing protein [Candidatus Bathyarchaeota archaeon]|jgi:methyl-accepting chemotaxis protein|nr:GAF domain-containing protein [Candidatus Bathyarchaeota archaeon]
MKIRTRVLVSAMLSIGLILMFGFLLSLSKAKVRVSSEAEAFVDHVVEEVFELSVLTSEYVSSRSKSSEFRWGSKHETIGAIIESTEFDDHNRAQIWARVAENHRSAKDIFTQIEETSDREELQVGLLDQLTFKSQTIISNAFALKQAIAEDLARRERQAGLLSGLFIVLLILVSTISTIVTIRTVVAPVAKLHEGVEIIRRGNLDHRIGIASRDEIGQLSRAFDEMTASLKEERDQIQREVLLKAGIAELSDVMRGEKDISTLCDGIISYLAQHLNAQVGTICRVNAARGTRSESRLLSLAGSYAYRARKNTPTEFKFGEGLIGQAAQEKKRILVTDVPENYITVTSTLGETVPCSVLCFPFLYEGEVEGVIELGSLDPFTEQQLAFLDQVGDSIAIVVHSARSREQTKALLEGSQAQAEELQSQEEELRTRNEELQATVAEVEVQQDAMDAATAARRARKYSGSEK